MQSQPLTTIAPPPPAEKREDFSQGGVNLDLGIGSRACADEGGLKENKKIKQEKKECFFTAAQFNDFNNQILVFNCITSGLHVPFHLFLPIWISVFNSFGPAVYKIYPSFIGFSAPNSDHHRTKMDPEPDRCRRTDGRKWRCSKNAVPNQKYCERHMHRGRQGSRKHVEPNASLSKPDCKISIGNRMPISSLVAFDIDNRIAITAQNDFDQSQPDQKCNHAEGKESSFENANPRKIGGKKHGTVKNNYMGFGSSPKSVLHCGPGKEVGLGSKNVIENVPQRCRRTDGKKWQCSRESLPNQKYCQTHMHRGAKRVMLNPQSASNFPGPCARKASSSCNIAISLENNINLNTIPTNPRHISDDNSTSSSSSDATTITDENISFCLAHSLTNC